MRLKRAAHIVVLTVAAFTGIWSQEVKSTAYSESEIGTEAEIGQTDRQAGGYSHVGVKIYWENSLVGYALDTWKKASNYPTDQDWNYIASNYNGKIHYFTEDYSPTDSVIWLKQSASEKRFLLRNNEIRQGKTEYSVIMTKMGYGKETEKKFEIANIPAGEFGTVSLGEASIQNAKEETALGERSGIGESYIYQIYDVRNIRPGEEIPANTGGGRLETPGKAYYNGSAYVITKLPTASYVKPGYTCTFEGWYNAADGGKQYKAGDIVYKGNTLYAHWKISPNTYKVTCIDVLGTDETGTVLGQSSWQAACGQTVSGEKAGTDAKPGAYYSHCCYTGSSSTVVGAGAATVYRYFSYENIPVQYIDQIESGKKKGELLRSTTEERPYASIVSGADLGDDTTPGAYYKGYTYSNCTSGKAEKNMVTIYRYFKPVTGKLLFEANGAQDGSMDEITSCEYGERIKLPKNQLTKKSVVTLYHDKEKKTKDTVEVSHNFLGWSDEPNGVLKYTDGDYLEYDSEKGDDRRLYAVWSSETVTLPKLSSKIGYCFLGWAGTADAVSGSSQLSIKDATELYAVWKPDIVKYHVELYKEKMEGGYELTSNYEFESYADEIVSIESNENAYPGFSLDRASSTLSGKVKADGSLILCAYYQRNTYSIKYDLNGGSPVSGQNRIQGQSALFGKNVTLSKSLLERNGYTFTGWSQNAAGDAKTYQPGESFTMQNHDVTLYAQWSPLSIKISYDKNEKGSKASGISGTVPDTVYQKETDCFVSTETYTAADAFQTAWNTKPDGSGKTVLPGQNVKGFFDSEKEIVLYAIWEQRSALLAPFQINICDSASGKTETLLLQGKAGESVKDALARIYQKELDGEDSIYFYKGYEVTNADALEKIISLTSETVVTVTVKERNCRLSFVLDGLEETNMLPEKTTAYQESITLPEKLSDGGTIARFVDANGNIYYPGADVRLEKNLELTVQQMICLHDERSTEKEEMLYVKHGEDFTFPERAVGGYRFLGWYLEGGEKAADAGQIQKKITKRYDYYAKWSEPLLYSISYELADTGVKILENEVKQYQHTKEVTLPSENQVLAPLGYRFVGWYEAGDSAKTLITKITSSDYGDKKLCPLLTVEAEGDGQNTGFTEKPGDSQSSMITVPQPDGKSDKKQTSNEERKEKNSSKKGNVFWKGNLKYRLISDTSKKKSVCIVGNRWKKASLRIPKTVKYGKVTYQITQIGKKAFYGNKYIRKIVTGASVTKIQEQAFAKMKVLKKVTIGKKVTQIGKRAFYKSGHLKKVVIKNRGIKKIGKEAFRGIGKKVRL